jgi:hypothetical protein
MKQFGILFLFIFILTASSCTREFICQCKVSYKSVTPGMPDTTIQEYLVKDTRKGAKSACEANSSSVTKNGVTITENCVLY